MSCCPERSPRRWTAKKWVAHFECQSESRLPFALPRPVNRRGRKWLEIRIYHRAQCNGDFVVTSAAFWIEINSEENPDFGSEELRKNLLLKSDKRIAAANKDVITLGTEILDTMFAKLREIHGTKELRSGQKAYWEIGVESQKP